MSDSLTAPERETIIRWDDESEVVSIWTAQRTLVTRLGKDARFTRVAGGLYGSTPWAEYTIPVDRFTFGAKRVLSEATKLAMAERAKTHGFASARPETPSATP